MMQLIEKQVALVKQLTDALPETEWGLEYSPEAFSMTELPVALEACNTAIRAWNAGPGRPIIINLPTTVENATPNIYADQIEWMSTHLERREHVVHLAAHPQRSRHRRRGRRAGHARRRRARRRLFVRQRRALGQRRSGEPRAELLFAGHPSRARFLGHQRHRARSRTGHAPAHSSAASRTSATWCSPRSPARTRTRSGRASRRRSRMRSGKCRTSRWIRPISAARTTASCASTASPARAASPIYLNATTAW